LFIRRLAVSVLVSVGAYRQRLHDIHLEEYEFNAILIGCLSLSGFDVAKGRRLNSELYRNIATQMHARLITSCSD
jgi:hypothetical protein